MDKCCPMSRVVAPTSVKIISLSSFSSPSGWTGVVGATSVKLSEVDMLLVLQARPDFLVEGSLSI